MIIQNHTAVVFRVKGGMFLLMIILFFQLIYE
jgi:hypothetical protein